MSAPGSAPRRAAVELLRSVLEDHRMLADGQAALGLAPAERARALALARSTLRHLPNIDALLATFLKKPPPPRAMAVLRVAVAEMRVLNAPAHGVVNGAVTALRADSKSAGFAGLANAVLRKVDTEGPALWSDMPPPALPKWLRKALVKVHGAATVSAMEAVFAMEPPTDVTLRPGATAPEGGLRLASGSVRYARAGQISALPGYEAGEWWVQDAAAALPAQVLGDVAGLRVLDLCAAPGGKTMQLAAAGAHVTALDISAARLERLSENLARTGLAAEVIAADALEWSPPAPFDAILLDAPCTATGTIRRHPDLPHIKDRADVAGLIGLQGRLFERALGWLKPGAPLVYCVCSLLPDEGERQVERFLPRHEGLRVDPIDPAPLGGDGGWAAPHGGLRLRPDFWSELGGMDGFYIARLRQGAAA